MPMLIADRLCTPLPLRLPFAFIALLILLLGGCGGGSTDGTGDPTAGSLRTLSVNSRITGTSYPVTVHLPPESAGPRQDLPVIYALDGESWLHTLVAVVEASRTPAIVVAIHSAGTRSHDYVPANGCTQNGGGNGRFLDFLRQELIPLIESTVGGHPARRVLFGHSHGGSLALYALFSESPGRHSFKSYLSSDASIGCLPDVAYGWEHAYAAAHANLPVRLHLSYASQGNHQANLDYAQALARRNYGGLRLSSRSFNGTHGGIVPEVLAEGIPFALADGP